MANNRLYLLDPETNETFYLGKGFTVGWDVRFNQEELNAWLHGRDIPGAYGSRRPGLKLIGEVEESRIAKRATR